MLSDSSSARANFHISSASRPDAVFRQIRVDPVERTVTMALDAPLLPDSLYVLRVLSSTRVEDQLASFDGTPFEGQVEVRFRTKKAADPGDTEDVDIDPVPADPCAVETLLASACTGSACHGSLGPTATATPPAMGLNLLTGRAVQETAVGKAAVLVQSAAHPGGGGAAPLGGVGFPRGLPLVDPRRGGSNTSFLLFKILMRGPRELPERESPTGADLARLTACTSPSTCPFPALAAPDLPPEVTWRRTMGDLAGVIPGSGMPHANLLTAPGGFQMAPLTLAEIRRIRAWIDGDERHLPASACVPGTADGGLDGASDATDGAIDGATDGATDAASDTADAADG